MRRNRVVVAALLVLPGGCVTNPVFESDWHTYGGGEKSLLLIENARELLNADAAAGPALPTPHNVWELDVTNGAARVAAADVTAFSGDIVANERWIAGFDRGAQLIFAQERATGAVLVQPGGAELVADAAGSQFAGQLLGIVGDLLIGQSGEVDAAGCLNFVLVDLAAQHVQSVANSWQYATYATDGRNFAFMDCLPADVPLLALELSTNIRLADLATGSVQVIRPNIRVSGATPGLFLRDEVVYWEEFKPDSFKSRVRAFDIATGELGDRFADFDVEGRDRTLLAVGADFAVVLTRGDEPSRDFAKPAQLEMWSFDGKHTLLAESVAFQQALYFNALWIVGPRIVWQNPASSTGEFVVYDTSSGSIERVQPPSE